MGAGTNIGGVRERSWAADSGDFSSAEPADASDKESGFAVADEQQFYSFGFGYEINKNHNVNIESIEEEVKEYQGGQSYYEDATNHHQIAQMPHDP